MITNSYLDVLGQINLDELHIRQAFEYYQARYQKSKLVQRFVTASFSVDDDVKNAVMMGYCDRTMGKHIPNVRTPEGAAIRGSLQRCGLIRSTGHELFRGCIVLPTAGDNGCIISAIGYRVGRVRGGGKSIVYWRKPEPKAFVDAGLLFAKELIHGQTYH